MTPVLVLLRPKQWTKNLLVFAALIFVAGWREPALWSAALACFAAFCLLSSGSYIVNDLFDLRRDRSHPKKRLRPLAAGQVAPVVAGVLAVVLLGGGGAVAFAINTTTGWMATTYVGIQALYNLALKHLAPADVFAISLGFVLRAMAGAAALSVAISSWLLVCSGTLALMLGFGKRLHEWLEQGDTRGETRESLRGYSRTGLEMLVALAGCAAALSYGVYSIESETAQRHGLLVATTPFVFYGVCRYLLLMVHRSDIGEPESLLLRDAHIVASIVGFLVVAVYALSTPTPAILSR